MIYFKAPQHHMLFKKNLNKLFVLFSQNSSRMTLFSCARNHPHVSDKQKRGWKAAVAHRSALFCVDSPLPCLFCALKNSVSFASYSNKHIFITCNGGPFHTFLFILLLLIFIPKKNRKVCHKFFNRVMFSQYCMCMRTI